MTTKHTISINGIIYDAVTGLPIEHATSAANAPAADSPAAPAAVASTVARQSAEHSVSVHRRVQKSTTLRRSHLKAPKNNAPVQRADRPRATHTAKSPMIAHFAPHPKPLRAAAHHGPRIINDIGPATRKAVAAPAAVAAPTSSHLKERLIAQASHQLATPQAATPAHSKPKRSLFARQSRLKQFAAAGAAAVVLIAYVAYLNIPSISVRLAAAQSGVSASYPTYNPDGYSFQGPVAFNQGEVEVHFKSNGGGEGYSIKQRASDWNSVAVVDNVVAKAAGNNYQAHSSGGVTIYTYGSKAAWTNGGILYTIDGNAPLSEDQLVQIAESM